MFNKSNNMVNIFISSVSIAYEKKHYFNRIFAKYLQNQSLICIFVEQYAFLPYGCTHINDVLFLTTACS